MALPEPSVELPAAGSPLVLPPWSEVLLPPWSDVPAVPEPAAVLPLEEPAVVESVVPEF
ncbi:MAG TPA: hypothetical protein VGC06_21730 [Actinomycetes bacterium]